MNTVNLFEYLSSKEYPGRGIAVGRTVNGEKIRIAYFIMGRSENSRNRVFLETEDGIRTEAYDPSKMSDPSLIIYHPVRVLGDTTIVTNGDQTDTIWNFAKEGKPFEEALRTRTFEPDGPNWTPRISAEIKGNALKMSILKSDNGDDSNALRYFFEYNDVKSGTGRIIHTYKDNGSPIPSFEGEPVLFEVGDESFEDWSHHVWDALNSDNKVSLFTRQLDPSTGDEITMIFNKNEGE